MKQYPRPPPGPPIPPRRLPDETFPIGRIPPIVPPPLVFNQFSETNNIVVASKPVPKHEPIFCGHLIKPDVNFSSWVHEIFFDKPYRAEGIHIVPNKFTVKNYLSEGRTIPDIYSRPFDMSIYSRRSTKTTIQHVISVKVTGGVEWLPFPLPDKAVEPDEVNYLAIMGDFESLSIIIHGCEVSEECITSELPLPSFYDEFSIPYIEKSDTLMPTNTESNKSTENSPLEFAVFDELNQPVTDLIERNFATYLDLRISSWYGNLVLPADKIDVFMNTIVDLKSCLESDLRQVKSKIEILASCLLECWQVNELINDLIITNINNFLV